MSTRAPACSRTLGLMGRVFLVGFLVLSANDCGSSDSPMVPNLPTPPPPPPPPGGANVLTDILVAQSGPNEQPGFVQRTLGWTVLNDYGEHRECSPIDGACFFNPSQHADADFPNSPGLINTWPVGFGDNAAWPNTRGRSGGTRIQMIDNSISPREQYLSVRVKLMPNYNGGQTGVKIIGGKSHRQEGGTQNFWLVAMDAARRVSFDYKHFNDSGLPGTVVNTPTVVRSSFTLNPGQTYNIEVYMRANSAPAPIHQGDGQLIVWVDGVERLNVQSISFFSHSSSASAGSWSGVNLDPIPGGRTCPTSCVLSQVAYDDLYASAR